MNFKAVPYKPRKHPSITIASPLFQKAIQEGDYTKASKIVVWNALSIHGAEGIFNALFTANLSIKRKKYRRGLDNAL